MPAREPLPGYLSPKSLTCILQNALAEDVGEGDITSNALIPEHHQGRGTLVMREDGVVAGLVATQYTFNLVDPTVKCNWVFEDGNHVWEESVIGTVAGPLRSILTAERLALNLLQRMSGIATATASMIESIQGSKPLVRDTRKTAPGLRLLDKWAVMLGGGVNHRIGLYDRVMIKDNHIEAVGGLAASVRCAAEKLPHCLIDVEARTMAEVEEAITVAELIDVLLLDNMTVHKSDGTIDCSRLKQAVDYIDGRIKTEATGGITLKTAPIIATTGVDYLSCGALTHSVRAIDIALNVS
ncbi:MAG: carboxylating nicotinate-nucleotide diphosphorylase [Bacteroidota bacterium]|nr:carboxylating nicotinate-nucleotide diphosphorylase [Bacteroidota bacterium]